MNYDEFSRIFTIVLIFEPILFELLVNFFELESLVYAFLETCLPLRVRPVFGIDTCAAGLDLRDPVCVCAGWTTATWASARAPAAPAPGAPAPPALDTRPTPAGPCCGSCTSSRHPYVSKMKQTLLFFDRAGLILFFVGFSFEQDTDNGNDSEEELLFHAPSGPVDSPSLISLHSLQSARWVGWLGNAVTRGAVCEALSASFLLSSSFQGSKRTSPLARERGSSMSMEDLLLLGRCR